MDLTTSQGGAYIVMVWENLWDFQDIHLLPMLIYQDRGMSGKSQVEGVIEEGWEPSEAADSASATPTTHLVTAIHPPIHQLFNTFLLISFANSGKREKMKLFVFVFI